MKKLVDNNELAKKKEMANELRNKVIIECMVDLKNEIIQLEKDEKVQIEISLKIEEENNYNGRLKIVRDELRKLRNIQWQIQKKKRDISEFFMNYKETKEI